MEQNEQKKMLQELEGSDREIGRKMGWLVSTVAIGLAFFHLYVAGFGLPGIGSRTFLVVHLMLGIILAFLIFPIKKGLSQKTIPWYDLLLAAASLAMGIYLINRQTAEAIMSAMFNDEFNLYEPQIRVKISNAKNTLIIRIDEILELINA